MNRKSSENTVETQTEWKKRYCQLYAVGMSQRDIAEQIESLYGVEISPELVSKISERILPQITEWQNRRLEETYPFVFMDAIHYKVRDDGRVVNKAAYVVLGVNMDGCKDILGIWIGESESSKFWLSVMNDLKSRGVKSVYLFCVDGLSGFREAIGAAFPKASIRRCIIHQIRSSSKFVSFKDIKAYVADLKLIYTAATEEEAFSHLCEFKETWGKKYPSGVKSWEDNWDICQRSLVILQKFGKSYIPISLRDYIANLEKSQKPKAVSPMTSLS